jgi:hypothetical protein
LPLRVSSCPPLKNVNFLHFRMLEKPKTLWNRELLPAFPLGWTSRTAFSTTLDGGKDSTPQNDLYTYSSRFSQGHWVDNPAGSPETYQTQIFVELLRTGYPIRLCPQPLSLGQEGDIPSIPEER